MLPEEFVRPAASLKHSNTNTTSTATAIHVTTLEGTLDTFKDTILKKNADYGSSVYAPCCFNKEGGDPASGLFWAIQHKLNRLETLRTQKGEANFESVSDTLFDLAGYSILLYHWYVTTTEDSINDTIKQA